MISVLDEQVRAGNGRRTGRFGCYFQTIGLPVQTFSGAALGLAFVPVALVGGGPILGTLAGGAIGLLSWLMGKSLGFWACPVPLG